MQCPKCGYKFSLLRFLLILKPSRTKCPECKALLKCKNTLGWGKKISLFFIILVSFIWAFIGFPIILLNVPQFVAVLVAKNIFGYRLFYQFIEVEKRSGFITLFSRFIEAVGYVFMFSFFLLGLISWTKINPDINPEIHEFLAKAPSPAPEDNNAAYAIMGMLAPSGTKDTYEWGKMIQKKMLKGFHNPSVSSPLLQDNLLEFKLENNSENHFIRKALYDLHSNTNHEYNRKKFKERMKLNKEIIDRYFEIYKYTELSGDLARGNQVINAQSYILTDAVYKAMDGNIDDAFDIWLKNFNVHKRFIGALGNSITRSIIYVNYGLNLSYLNLMLLYSPELAQSKYKEIKQAIKPLEIKDTKPENLIYGEFLMANNALIPAFNSAGLHEIEEENIRYGVNEDISAIAFVCLADGVAFKNKAFELTKDRIYLSTLKPSEALEYNSYITEKYDVSMVETLYHHVICDGEGVLGLVLSGIAKGGRLITFAHKRNAQMRALNILLDIKAKNIPREDVAEFIKNSPKEYYDPYTEQPIIWDEEKGSMFVACEKLDENNIYSEPNYKNLKCKEIQVFFN